MKKYFEPLFLLWAFSFLPAIPGQLTKLDQDGSEDKGESPGAPLEVAKDEELDCKSYVCDYVKPGEDDIEEGVHVNNFEFSEIHVVADFLFLSAVLDTLLGIENIETTKRKIS